MITDNIEKVVEEEDEYFDSEIEPSVPLPIILNDKFASPINALKEKLSVVNDLNESITTINSPLITNKTTIKEIYAVSFADKSINSNPECCRIFINRENAMKLCRQDPQNRRFKNFRSFKEAYAFSYESNEIESGQVPTIRQVHASLAASLTTTTINGDVQLSPQLMQIDSKTPSQDAEKLPFSGPKKIEINEMRSFIEKNNLEAFSAKIISNPRFLISAGDSPIIFQESFRYNALHICAKENRPEICEFLLKTLNSVAFIQKLYVNDSIEQSRTRSQHLLDLYINMPEKGLNETPLHFACKFGSLEVVRQIISYDVCSRNQLNKNQKTAQDLICTKTTNKQNFSEIKSLFEDCLYLPLYRDYESSSVIIEKPCAKLEPEFENSKTNNKTPNRYVNRSQHRLAAYVGPISPTNANAIYERLKSPAKLRQSPSNLDILRSDEYKGYERIVRKITDEMNMPWTEYWSFLDSFCDFKKNEGLTKLEVYLEQKKFQNILESQVQSVINMLKTNRLNEAIVNKLNEFMQVVDDLKRALDLKENQLSYTYEHIFKTAKCLQNFTLPLTFKSNKHEDELNENELNFFNVILPHYMTVIIDLSKTDKCYFNLYKTSKCLLELLNCQKMFEQFYLSPIFKEKCGNLNGKSKKKKSSNKPKYNLSSDDEEEEDDEENDEFDNENDIYEDDLNQDEMIGTNMDESYITSENLNKKDDTDDISNLLSNFSLNPKEPELNNKQESKENNISVTPFRRPTNNPYINNNNKSNFKLFMFGDQPSKLDRAVYLCIESNKSCRIDLSYYPILNEWFNYMKSVDQNEMTSWKTPMKKKEPLKCKVINSMNI